MTIELDCALYTASSMIGFAIRHYIAMGDLQSGYRLALHHAIQELRFQKRWPKADGKPEDAELTIKRLVRETEQGAR